MAGDLVSLVVTSYNHAEYLDRRMESLLAQTHPNTEIIVVDDCSTDGSQEVLEKYAGRPGVSLRLLDKNGGYAAATNLGVSLARGDYVMIAECDDYSEPAQVSTLLAGLRRDDGIVAAYSRSAMVDGQGRRWGSDFAGREPRFKACCTASTVVASADMQRFLLRACVIPNMSAALFRKRAFAAVGGLSSRYRVCADWDFWCRMAATGDFYYASEELNNFRTHATSVRNTAGMRIQALEIFSVLYRARAAMKLSSFENLGFRTGIGVVWASYLRGSPRDWLAAFPEILVGGFRHDRLIVANLLLGLCFMALTLFRRTARALFGSQPANKVHPLEWPRFAATCRRQPWQVPGYGFGILRLVGRRFVHRLRRCTQRDPHLGLKEMPPWLSGEANLTIRSGEGEPGFPACRLPPDARAPVLPTALAGDDPEAYYARHRWGECAAALGDGPAAAAAFQAARRWIEAPPPKSDPAWEPYSCCERVANLAILLAAHPELRQREAVSAVGRFVAETLAWIADHLEYYGPQRTNNHILNNARALVVGGAVIGSRPALVRGLALFSRMAPALIQPDGFLRERSSHYQAVICNWVFDALRFARFAREQGEALPGMDDLEALAGRVGAATAALMSCAVMERVHIGDISPDMHPSLSWWRLRNLYPDVLSASPVRAGRLDDWTFLGDGQDAVIACVPPGWPLDYTTHGHADLCGFVWSCRGQAILVDAGRNRYMDDGESRLQAGPEGHNTLRVNGFGPLSESLLRTGLWYPTPYAAASTGQTVESATRFSIRHDGFRRIGAVGEHVRTVTLRDRGLTVIDDVDGQGEAEIELFWHFPPGWTADAEDGLTVTGDGNRASIRTHAGGAAAPRRYWLNYSFSGAYGQSVPAPMLRLNWCMTLPCSIRTDFELSPCAVSPAS